MPVYLATQHDEMSALWPWMALATAGITVGTVLGSRLLDRLSEPWFRRILALILAVLGGAMLVKGIRS